MANATGKVMGRIVGDDDIQFLKEKVSEILAKKGMIIEHPQVLKCLKKAGAEVESSTNLVKFPKKLQEEALKLVPDNFVLAGIDPQYDLYFPHPDGLFHTRTITGAQYEYTPEGEFRNVTLDVFAEWIQLVNYLEHVGFYSLLTITPTGFPTELHDVYALHTALLNTYKHGWLQPIEAKNNKWFIELAAARVGGIEELRKRPCISMISCCTSPLYLKHMDAEAIYQGAINKIPTQCCSLPVSACTAPVTQSGTVLLGVAEVIGMIITAQCINPGTPVIAANEHFAVEMNAFYTVGHTIEMAMGRMLTVQLIKEGYGLACHLTSGGSDAIIHDAQSCIDQLILKNNTVLAGADVVGDLGYLETGRTMSKLLLIIENECCGMLKKLKAGMVINEDTTAFNEIMKIDHHYGNFLDNEHTLKFFREIYVDQYKLFNRECRDNWRAKGKKDLFGRAAEVYQAMKRDFEEIIVPDDIKKEMDKVLKAAVRDIVG